MTARSVCLVTVSLSEAASAARYPSQTSRHLELGAKYVATPEGNPNPDSMQV